MSVLLSNQQGNGIMSPTTLDAPDINIEEQQRFQSRVHLEINQMQPQHAIQPQENKPNFERPFSDGDFEFVRAA